MTYDRDKAIHFIKSISPNENLSIVPHPAERTLFVRKPKTMAPKPPVVTLDSGIVIEHIFVKREHILLGINRDIRPKWVQELRNTWDPVKVGVPTATLSLTDPGKVEPITGNHRWLAIMEGIMTGTIDGLVVEMMFRKNALTGRPMGLTEEEKADIWFADAVKRKPATAPDVFHNALRRKVPTAIALDKLIRSIGRVPATNKNATPRNIVCFVALNTLYQRDAITLERLFPLLGDLTAGHVFHDRLVRAIFFLEKRAKTSLTTERWSKRLMAIGYDKLLRTLHDVVGTNSEHLWAQAVLDAINYGRKTNLLTAEGLATREPGSAFTQAAMFTEKMIDPTSVPTFKAPRDVSGSAD